jgi:hypothetical protein
MIKVLSPYRQTSISIDPLPRVARYHTDGTYSSIIYQKNNKYIISSSELKYYTDPWLEINHIANLKLAKTILDAKLIDAGFILINSEEEFDKYCLLI